MLAVALLLVIEGAQAGAMTKRVPTSAFPLTLVFRVGGGSLMSVSLAAIIPAIVFEAFSMVVATLGLLL